MISALSEAPPQPVRLAGFDRQGEPFRSGDRVMRGIYPGYASQVRRVLAICERQNLFDHGIVNTRELTENPYPALGYEMVLEHERVPFITYPHEWSASMFGEAALFHIRLFEVLAAHGLTLKDWHPYNVLFDGTKPVFVDFTSIIPVEALASEIHLVANRPSRGFDSVWDDASRAVYQMYTSMFEPYFALPMVMMHRGRHALARQRLGETALNTSRSVITRAEAFAGNPVARAQYEVRDRMLRVALTEKGLVKEKFFKSVREVVATWNVAVTGSAYASYYEDKGEAFSREPQPEWTNKQRVVNDALERFHPRTVLDLGSNTGWFSMLAAKHGCDVIGVDVDEASIDRLFASARKEGMSIVPLVANLAAAQPPRHGLKFETEPSSSLLGDDTPVIESPLKRLRCDMTMALAIVHHLALGQALTFEAIASLFDSLAEKQVCVEFVDMDDRMITSEPEFFPAYNAARGNFGWYTRDNFIAALRTHFHFVDVLPSFPDTRTMLVCSR